MGIIGYKVFNPDWTCRGFQYEVGKIFVHEGPIEMCCYYSCNTWVPDTAMTEKEKEQNPEYSVTGRYLKTVDHKTACEIMWGKMTDEEKAAVKDLPNFDADIFEEITGIHVD